MGMRETLDDYKEKLSAKTDSPVIAVLGVQPRGAAGAGGASIGLSRISPLASMVVNKVQGAKTNDKAGGLGKITSFSVKSALLALTADKLYAFESKYGMGGLKVKDPIASWDRKDVKVTAVAKKATSAIDIEVIATGDIYEVEAMTMMGGGTVVEDFVAALGNQ
jgi:hypothetical protein